MFANAISHVSRATFPIFFDRREGSNITVGILGTGFFIDNEGTFLSACHVIDQAPSGARKFYLGTIPNRRISEPQVIEEIRRNNNRDIFLGRIDTDHFESLSLAEGSPPIGKTLCLCGYPMAEIINVGGRINTNNVRQYYQPTFVLDGFQGPNRDPRGTTRQHIGFMTRDATYPGMSGGPVFDIDGVVWGMSVALFHRDIPRPPDPDPIEVINGIAVKTEILSQLINENNSA